MNRRIRRTGILLLTLLLGLCAVLPAGAEKTEIVNLGGAKINELSYAGTLPDGRIVLRGYKHESSGSWTAWLLCLNSDRTVSWEYTDDSDESTRFIGATVLEDGTIGTVMKKGQASAELRFFTKDGEPAGNEIRSIPEIASFVSAAGNRFLVMLKEGYQFTLFDWDGNEIAWNPGKKMVNGIIGEPDGLVMYGRGSFEKEAGIIWKTDDRGNLLWETELSSDWQDWGYAVLVRSEKTGDGGYLGIQEYIKDANPDAGPGNMYELVKLDGNGNVLWTNREIFEGITEYCQGIGHYNGKYAAVFSTGQAKFGYDNWKIAWLDEEGTSLGTVRIQLEAGDFDWLADYAKELEENGGIAAAFPGEGLIPMKDGLWMPAMVTVLYKKSDSSYLVKSEYTREVLIKVPEP